MQSTKKTKLLKRLRKIDKKLSKTKKKPDLVRLLGLKVDLLLEYIKAKRLEGLN